MIKYNQFAEIKKGAAKKIIFLIFGVIVFSNAQAGSLEDGLKAIDLGEFEKAYAVLKPIAEKGNSQAQYNLDVRLSLCNISTSNNFSYFS